jgi:Peptidase family S41
MSRVRLVALLVLGSCGSIAPAHSPSESPSIHQQDDALRSLTKAEALADFDVMAASFRALYGALDRKQQRYGFNFDTLVSDFRGRVERASGEAEYRGLFQEFIARFQDPHLSLESPLSANDTKALVLPFHVVPLENTYAVYAVGKALQGTLNVGEELLSIDGRTTDQMYAAFEKYVGVANPLAKKHLASYLFTTRDVYLSKGIDASKPASVEVRGLDGLVRKVSVAWIDVAQGIATTGRAPTAGTTTRETAFAASSQASIVINSQLTRIGANTPFYMTQTALATLDRRSTPALSSQSVAQAKLTAAQAKAFSQLYYTLEYTTAGKRVLFLRIPDYQPQDVEGAFAYLSALLKQEQSKVDVLVLDETHNPGGNVFFAQAILTLLAKKDYDVYAQQMHADRKWLEAFLEVTHNIRSQSPTDPALATFEGYTKTIDDAYTRGDSLSPALPFFDTSPKGSPDVDHWTKPFVIVADELSVSCADLVPLVVKKNGMGTVFGETTMGGGGNVEAVAVLPNTQATLQLSRGLGTVYDPTGAYADEWFVEDNGVTPDVQYTLTLADFRAGFVGYVQALNAVVAAAR